MMQYEISELCRRKKDQTVRLRELRELTEQLAEAVERRDEVSARMALSMRQLPLEQVQEIETGIGEYLLTLPEEEAVRLNELLRGGEAHDTFEEELSEQVSQYRRALESVTELDRRISIHVAGKRSFYTLLGR